MEEENKKRKTNRSNYLTYETFEDGNSKKKKKILKEMRAFRKKETRSLNQKTLGGRRRLYINIDDNHDTALEL